MKIWQFSGSRNPLPLCMLSVALPPISRRIIRLNWCPTSWNWSPAKARHSICKFHIFYIFDSSVTPNYCRRNNIIKNLVEPYLLCEFQLSLIIFRRCMAVILFLTSIMALTWRHWRQINIRLDNFEDLVYTFPQWKFLIILITYHHLMALLVHLTTQ